MNLHTKYFKIALPNILSNLTIPLAGIIDIALLGHLPDISDLAGVALATVLFDYIYWSFGFLRMGTTGQAAQCFGSNDSRGALQIFLRSIILAIVIGLTIIALQGVIASIGFSVLQGSDGVKDAGRAYFDIRIWTAPATLSFYAISGWFIGMQRSSIVLLLSILLNGLNILFDWIFIYHYSMGAYGAGLATLFATYFAVISGITILIMSTRSYPKPTLISIFDRSKLVAFFKLNSNLLVRTFFLISVFSAFTNISSWLGPTILAANTIIMKLINSTSYFIDGYAFALEALAGSFHSTNSRASLQKVVKISLLYTYGTICICIVGILFTDQWIYSLFASSQHHLSIIALCSEYTPYLLITLCVSGCAYIFDGFFIGLTAGSILRNSMILSTLIGFVPFAIAAVLTGLNSYLWIGIILFMFLRSLTLVLKYRKLILDSDSAL